MALIAAGIATMGFGALQLAGDSETVATQAARPPLTKRTLTPNWTIEPAPATTHPSSPSRATPTVTAPAVRVPERVEVPRLNLKVDIVPTGVGNRNQLLVPEASVAGWYDGGAKLGESGPMVLVGHKDDRDGPAAFYGLIDLQPGDQILVDDTRWHVDRLELADKDNFPTDEVYGDTKGPTLRLITCDGEFDESSGHYEDNLVVYASRA